MDPAVAKAAARRGERPGQAGVRPAPQNKAGVETVIAAGVDVMAHTVPSQPDGYTAEQLARFKAQNVVLIPTLSLFTTIGPDLAVTARVVAATVHRLRQFPRTAAWSVRNRCRLYQAVDTGPEYEVMHRALSERQILASLTTNPADYFKSAKKGRVQVGFDADLVVLDGDPMSDVANFAKVATTIRAGTIIYQRP